MEIIFELHRPLIRDTCLRASATIEAPPAKQETTEQTAADVKQEEGDVAGDEEGEIEAGEAEGQATEEAKPMEVEDGQLDGSNNADDEQATAKPTDADTAAWNQLKEQALSLAPDKGFQCISTSLFLTFWSLSLYDLEIPVGRYETVINQLRSSARIARDDIESARREAQRETQGRFAMGPGGYMRGGGYGRHGEGPAAPTIDVEQLSRDLERYV